MIRIGECAPETLAPTPLVVSIAARSDPTALDMGDASPVEVMRAVAGLLGDSGVDGEISYRDRRGCEWTVVVGASSRAIAS